MVRKLTLRAGVIGWVAPMAVGVTMGMGMVVGGACTELRGSIGADCLKNDDCLSNVCAQQHCAAPPPLLDAAFNGDDSASDATVEATTAPDGSGPSEDSSVSPDAMEAGPAVQKDAGVDAPGDVVKDAADDHADAPIDGPADGPVDAPPDAREAGGEAG